MHRWSSSPVFEIQPRIAFFPLQLRTARAVGSSMLTATRNGGPVGLSRIRFAKPSLAERDLVAQKVHSALGAGLASWLELGMATRRRSVKRPPS